jgi:hypothetical protein
LKARTFVSLPGGLLQFAGCAVDRNTRKAASLMTIHREAQDRTLLDSPRERSECEVDSTKSSRVEPCHSTCGVTNGSQIQGLLDMNFWVDPGKDFDTRLLDTMVVSEQLLHHRLGKLLQCKAPMKTAGRSRKKNSHFGNRGPWKDPLAKQGLRHRSGYRATQCGRFVRKSHLKHSDISLSVAIIRSASTYHKVMNRYHCRGVHSLIPWNGLVPRNTLASY